MDMEKRNPDKINGNVYYYDDEHVYVDKDTNDKFTSVTTLIHKYTHEFDSVFWSAYKALEALMDEDTFFILKKSLLATKKFHHSILGKFGINEEEFANKRAEILQSYDDERNKSCERGTRIHAEFENMFYNSGKSNLKKYGLGDLAGDFLCKKDYYDLEEEKGIYPEYLISKVSSDGILRIAGQIDLLIKDGNDIYIVDWKTNKEIKQKSYFNRNKRMSERMKFPLNHLDDCNYMHYTLQLSLYAYLLEQINPDFNIKLLKLIHVDHSDKQTEYVLDYRRDDVIKMLNHYKKQLKINMELSKDTPIKM